MRQNRLEKKDILRFSVIAAAVFLAKMYVLDVPYHWDSILFIRGALYFYNNFFRVFSLPCELEIGHPIFLHLLFSSIWKLFGYSLQISHIIIILFSSLCVYFTYKVSHFFMDKEYGVIVYALLLFSPLYFAQTGIVQMEIPLAAFAVLTVYYFISGRKALCIFFASVMMLTKAPGLLLVFSLILYNAIINRQKSIKFMIKLLLPYCVPVFVFLLWTVYHRLNAGSFIYDHHFAQFNFSINVFMDSFIARVRQLYVKDYRSITTGIMFIYYLSRKIPGLRSKAYILIPAIFTAPFVIAYLTNHYLGVLIFIFIFHILIAREMFRKEKFFLLFHIFIFNVLIFFSVYSDLPRYLLFSYPFYYILSIWSLNGIKGLGKASVWIIAAAVLLLHISQWRGDREIVSTGSGAFLESNLEYLDMVKTHKAACSFIEKNYPHAVVLSGMFPLTEQLRYPELGYVKNPIENYVYPGIAADTEYDLIYFSPQAHASEELKEFIEKSNVELIKVFSIRNKTAKIYRNQIEYGRPY